MPELSDEFRVGDIIQCKGAGVPRELEGKYFRVESVDAGTVRLSVPYIDPACTIRYRARLNPSQP